MFPLFAELFQTFSRARKSFLLLINTEQEWVEEEEVKVGLKAPLQMSIFAIIIITEITIIIRRIKITSPNVHGYCCHIRYSSPGIAGK